ncbi:AAA-ATPase-like domain-containing protein [Favolaschia claudopus]|uniref:AAA-ATPase-like domain-containing protein n=1 Tax=Favolaschia claudopus TaxID=2862362 RepID=A0AAW0B5M8_9AGAR
MLLMSETTPSVAQSQPSSSTRAFSPSSPSSSSGSSSTGKRSWSETSSSASDTGSKRVKRHAHSVVSPFTSSDRSSLVSSDLRLVLPRNSDGFNDFCAQSDVVFIDKKSCILELPERFRYLLLRPPQFGKSAFLSTLSEYYNIQGADEFQEHFKNLSVSTQAVPHRSQHLSLTFALSDIDAMGDIDDIGAQLDFQIINALDGFLIEYATELKLDNPDSFFRSGSGDKLTRVFDLVRASSHTLSVGVDDYDAPITNRTFRTLSHLFAAPSSVSSAEIESLVDRSFWLPLLAGSDVIDKLFLTGTFSVKYPALQDVSWTDLKDVPGLQTCCGFTEDEAVDLACSVLDKPDLTELRRSCGKYVFPVQDTDSVEPVLPSRQVIVKLLETNNPHPVRKENPFRILTELVGRLPLHSENPREASLDGLIELIWSGVIDCELDCSSSFDAAALRWEDLSHAGAFMCDRQSKVLRLENSAVLDLIHSFIDTIFSQRHGLDTFSDIWDSCNSARTVEPVANVVSSVFRDLMRSSFGTKHEPTLPGVFELVMGTYEQGRNPEHPKILFPLPDGRVEIPAHLRRAPYPNAPEYSTDVHIWELKTLTLRGMLLGANPNDDNPTPDALEKLYEDLLRSEEEEEEALLRRTYRQWSEALNAMETVQVGSFLDDDPVVPQFLSVGGARILLRVPSKKPQEPLQDERYDGDAGEYFNEEVYKAFVAEVEREERAKMERLKNEAGDDDRDADMYY